MGLSGLVAAAAPASAAPKGTLQLQRVNLTNDQVVPVTLTNYPAGEISIKECVVTKSSALTTSDCVPLASMTIPDTGATGRGDATASVTVKSTLGAIDCKVDWCAVVTEAADAGMLNAADATVKATITFTPPPTLAVHAPNGISRSTTTSVVISGKNFRPGTEVRAFQCKGAESVQSNCVASYFVVPPAADSTGNFPATAIDVKPTLTFGPETYDCLAANNVCSLQTSSKTSGADVTQQASVVLHFGAELRVSKGTGLSYSGETITVTGVQFAPNVPLFISECDVNSPTFGEQCNHNLGEFIAVNTTAEGTFSAPMKVKGAFEGANPVDCNAAAAQCGLQSVMTTAFGDTTQYATVLLSFGPKPLPTPTLTLSKSKIKVGDTVTLTGTNFPKTAKSLYVTICGNPPSATNCDMTLANIGQIAYTGTGSFTATYKVNTSKFNSGDGVIDCAKVQCVVGTTNAKSPADRSYNATATFTVDTSAPVAKAPNKAGKVKVVVKGKGKKRTVVITWAKAKANGTPVTGYTVQAKQGKKAYKTAGTTKASKTMLKWKKAKPGYTYKFRVIAKSNAGKSTSKVVKVKIKK